MHQSHTVELVLQKVIYFYSVYESIIPYHLYSNFNNSFSWIGQYFNRSFSEQSHFKKYPKIHITVDKYQDVSRQ